MKDVLFCGAGFCLEGDVIVYVHSTAQPGACIPMQFHPYYVGFLSFHGRSW